MKSKKTIDEAKSLIRPGIVKATEMKPTEYITMPGWWENSTGVPGLPFKKVVMISGDPDSGKTSFSIAAMKAAQEQDVTILYVETEGKTTSQDFVNWGVSPQNVNILQSSVAETIFDSVRDFLVSKKGSNEKILLILDSLGQVVSVDDIARDMYEKDARPGGKGKSNREGLIRILALRDEVNVATVIINYTYDNYGSPGKTNAGGKALNFISSLTYQTVRKAWHEKTVKGVKTRCGAVVRWKLFKNHLNKSNPGPREIEFLITQEGFQYLGGFDE